MTNFDYDLIACLENNPQPDFARDDILHVLAVYEGENDGQAWRWVLSLKNGQFAFLQGWCDYTGWDCRSDASSTLTDTSESAAKLALADTDHIESPVVYESLMRQIVRGQKEQTWREKKDAEFGVDSSETIE